MRLAARIALLAGLAVMIALIVSTGVEPLLQLLGQLGWALLWLLPLHAGVLLLDVCGWRSLLWRQVAMPRLWWVAAVREAIDRLLPVANVGGELVGIRLLVLRGVDGVRATASVIVELLLTLVSQYLYAALGVVCLLQATHAAQPGMLLGLAVSLPVIALLVLALRHGSPFARLQRLIERLLGERARTLLGGAGRLDAAIGELYAARTPLYAAVAWQLGGLVAGAFETWLVLRWLGHPVGAAGAIALESLTQAVRSFLFLVPAGLGVQEAGLVGFGHLLGLGGDVALALSLAKRLREILFGVPVLLGWQWVQGRERLAPARRGS